jgi:hypothetical protein
MGKEAGRMCLIPVETTGWCVQCKFAWPRTEQEERVGKDDREIYMCMSDENKLERRIAQTF